MSKPQKPPLKAPRISQAELSVISERSKKYDTKATSEACINDLRKVQEKYPTKSISRNFYRIHGKYSDATWSQFFGTFLEYRRQAGLELSRNQHSLERKIAKHASLDVYRDFYDTQVLPYHLKYNSTEPKTERFKTILVGSDFHDIDSDPFMLSVFIDTARRVQPDVVCLAGDIFDCPEFSRFSLDPREFKILERFNFVKKEIFGALRKACPKSQIDIVLGNHEIRILKLLADKTPAMRVLLSDVMGLSLANVFGLDEFKINMIAKVDLAAFSNPDIEAVKNENFVVYYDAFVCSHYKDLGFGLSGTSGHTHRPEQVTFTNIPMGKCTWTTMGCMAKTRMEYVEGRNQWTNSFLLAHVDTKNKTVSTEHFIVPGDSVVIHGKRYTRKESSK